MKIDDFLDSPQSNNQRAEAGRIDNFLGEPAPVKPKSDGLLNFVKAVKDAGSNLFNGSSNSVLANTTMTPEQLAQIPTGQNVLPIAAGENIISAIPQPQATVSNVIKGLFNAPISGAKKADAGLDQMLGDALGEQMLKDRAQRKFAQGDLLEATTTPDIQNDTLRGVYGGASSVMRQAPAIIAGILTRNPSVALSGTVAPMVPEKYAEYRGKGADPLLAGVGAIGQAGTEYITEKLPMGFLVNKFGKVGAGEFIKGLLGREIPSEQAATFIQDAIDTAIANPNKSWSQYAQERPDAMYQTLISTITQGGLMAGGNAIANRLNKAGESVTPGIMPFAPVEPLPAPTPAQTPFQPGASAPVPEPIPAQPAVNPIAALSELIAGTATQNSPLEPVSTPTADQFLGEPTPAPTNIQDDFLDTPIPQQESSTANKLDNAFMWRNGNIDVPIQVVAEKLGTNAAGQREILALVDGEEQSIPIDEVVRRGDAQALEIPQIPGNYPINNLESQDVIDIPQEPPNEATTMQKAEAAIPGSPIDPINPSTMQKAQAAIPEQINAPAFIDLDKHAQLQVPKPGMRIGDITHKNGSVFKTKQAAKDVAKKAGKGWVTAPSNQGFVVRFRPQTDKQVAATAKRIAKQREVRQSDSMLQAISKLGGINSDELVKDWGVSLADLGNKGSGVFRVATKGGMSADRMADSLKELGFISSDPITGKHDLAEMMDLFQEEARGGAKTYAHSDDGGKVAEQYSQYQNDGYDEWIAAKEAEEAGFQKLSEEAQTLIGEWVGEQYDRTQEEYAKLDKELAQWEQSGEIQDRIPEFNNESIDARGGRVAQEAGEFDSNPAGEDRGDQSANQANEDTGQKQSPVRQAGTGSQRSSEAGFSLESQTEAALKAAEEAKAAAEKAKQEADRAAEERAQTDAEVGHFNLTGSDRAADVAAAQGQGDILFSKQRKNWYFSPLERGIEAAPDRFFTKAPQIKLWLASNAAKMGVKNEEIEWSGINEWLDLQGKNEVSKQDILDYLKNGGVQINEVMLGEKTAINYDSKYAIPEVMSVLHDDQGNAEDGAALALVNDYAAYEALNKKFPELFDDENEDNWQDIVIDDIIQNKDNYTPTKYAKYTLPGGENYQELLLTLPNSSGIKAVSAVSDGDIWEVKMSDGNLVHFPENYAYDTQEAFTYAENQTGTYYKSSHWDQKNVLAHIRFNDRTDSEGNKVLFVEEIQSDWHQDGRKNGYQNHKARELISKEISDIGISKRVDDVSITDLEKAGAGQDLINRFDEVMLKPAGGVPDAPLKDTKAWTALAIKRITSYAVENGYSKVAFVNGEQSAERYDLSKELDAIEYRRSENGGGLLSADDKGGNQVLRKNLYSDDELEDHVGKDVAKKLLEQSPVSNYQSEDKSYVLNNADIKVGGEGMVNYYNKIVPQVVNDVLKKVGGGKIEPLIIKTGNAPDDVIAKYADQPDHPFTKAQRGEQLGFTITDNMRQAAADGLPLFSKNNRNARANIDWVQSQDQSHATLVKETFERKGYTQGTYAIIEPKTQPKVSGVYGGSASMGNQSAMVGARNTAGSQQATGKKNLSDTLAFGRQVSDFEKAFGRTVVFIQPNAGAYSGFNGFIIPQSDAKTIYINPRSEASFLSVAGHEYYEGLASSNPALHKWFERQATKYIKTGAFNKYQAWLQKDGAVHSSDSVMREMMADFVGDAIADPSFRQSLSEDSPSKFKAFLRGLVQYLSKLLNRLRGSTKTDGLTGNTGLGSDAIFNQTNELRAYLKELILAVDQPTVNRVASTDNVLFSKSMEDDLQDDIDLGVPKQKFEKLSVKDFFSLSKNEFGQRQYTAGLKLYKNLSTLASEHLGALKLADNKPEAFKQMMRQFKVDQLKASENAKRIAEAGMELSPEQRETLSDLIEKNAIPGDLPPTEIADLATKVTAALDIQAKQLLELGMISEERLVKNYLPRLYKHGLAAKLTNPTLLAGWFTKARMKIRGERLKTRGMFAEMPTDKVAMAKKLGWIPSSMTDGTELPKDLFEAFDKSQPIPPNYQDTKVLMWRDYTEAERAEMGEIRDGVFRYAMGYVETQKDVAIGRLFKAIAGNPELAKAHNPGGWKQVPNQEIKGAPGVKQYGALSGMYVSPQVLDALTRNTQPKGILMAAYDKALNFWKEGKTVWNPVSHGNNVVSNLFTVYFAGVNPASPAHWRETIREFRSKGEYWNEAVDNGLFGHEFANQEIQNMLMPDFGKMDDLESVAASRVAKVIEFSKKYPGKPLSWYREKMQKAYEFEDQFFKLMLYIDRRKSGMNPQEAITDAERYVFNYSDMPEGIELLKRTYSPFFAYTYKAIPMVIHTAMTRPDRLLAPIALLGGANWLAYMVIGGDEEKERKGMPEYMQGRTAIGTHKSVRMPFNIEGNPAFMDMSRRVPLGDLFDMNNQTNGLPLPAPFMPSHPVLSMMQAVIYNQDTFTGKDLVKKSDTKWEAAEARAAYLYRQFAPNAPMILGSYNFNKLMDASANTFDTEMDLYIGSYTGKTKAGDPIKAIPTVLDVFTGTKIRSFDPERGIDYQAAGLQKEAKEISANISSANRNQGMTPDSKGRYIASQQDKIRELQRKNEELRK